MEPLLNFYYRYWFRVEPQGVENVPADGGALLVANHSGALPPDAPMIMQSIRNEHPHPRPLYMLGEHWFKGYPGVGMLTNKLGLVAAHPANAERLLRDEGRLAIVFPEGQKGSRKLYWQRYRLRRFGRGGFIKTALRAGVPIVPVAVVGAEEAMPIFAHVPLLERLTGLIYFPINHAFPQFGPAAALMYMPAKFKIRFLEPVSFEGYGPEDADDLELVQSLAEHVRARIQSEVDALLASRESVWFG
jgi:1-acyl-sn-glycerol-3-phosphate acyltransferase